MDQLKELDKEIIGQALLSDHSYQIVSHLCSTYGSRFAGTQQEQEAAVYLAHLMKTYALKQVSLKPFSYQGWKRGKDSLFLCTAKGKHGLPVIGLPYSPKGQVEAQVVDVGDGTPEDFSSQDLFGKVVLVSALCPVYQQESMHRQDKYQRAIDAGAVGFLWMREVGGLLEETGSLPHDAPIPGVGLSLETGFKIKEALKEGPVQVQLIADHGFSEVKSFNVEGTIPGTSSGLLVVGAHYDGHDIGEGALDNAVGTAVLLETARLLNQYRDSLGRSISFVCFAAEEVGLLGSERYVAGLDEEVDFMINLDGGPGRPGRMGLALQNAKGLILPFKQIVASMGENVIIGYDPGHHSDMYSFSKAGIPSGYLKDMEGLSTGRNWGHTRADTLDKVEKKKLLEDTLLLSRFLLRASRLYPWPI